MLISNESSPIILEISDLIISNTVIKRKAQRNAITSPTGGLLVIVTGETGGDYISIYNENQTRWEKVNTTAD